MERYTRKLIGNEEERAVSPVIGVILMIAITVIMAAVIAAFVLDMGPGGQDVNAVMDIEGDGTTEVEATLTTLDNADGVVIVEDADDSDGSSIEHVMTVSGDSTSDFDGGEDYTVIAYSGDDPEDDDGYPDRGDLEGDDSLDISIIETFSVASSD